jgi:pyrimidine operon attenuation protein/uracil phosphoribosyltransferase
MLRSSISVTRIPQERSERKSVVLIDNIRYNGRTTRAALDALFDFGRPEKLSSEFLIDRCSIRRLSIQPDYIDKSIDEIA